MSSRFVRSIRNVKDINKQPLNTNEQNDFLSDENGTVYVRTHNKYERITGLNNDSDIEYLKSQIDGLNIPTDYNKQITTTDWLDINVKNNYQPSEVPDFKPSYCVVDYGDFQEVFIRFGFKNLTQSKNIVGDIPSNLVPHKMYRNGTTTIAKVPPKIVITTSGNIEIHQYESDEYIDSDYVIYQGSWIIKEGN